MFRRMALGVVIGIIFVVVLVFTYHNTGTLDVNLVVTTITTSIPIAFTVVFAVGWLFGILCMGAWALRLINERRSLRRALKVSESEVTSLRNLPLDDAN